MLVSNLGRNSNYPERHFALFLLFQNAGNRPKLSHYHFLPRPSQFSALHHSTVHGQLLAMLLNKLQVNLYVEMGHTD
jgi:hypothetical protein